MTRVKVWLPAALVVLVGAGVVLWWQGGGFGGPVSDPAAREYFDRIVAAALRHDFRGLCRLNGSEGNCREELRTFCPEGIGPGDAERLLNDDVLDRVCAESVPKDPPGIVSSVFRPARNGSVGGRVLLVRGKDGRGKAYDTEVMIFRDRRTYKATHAVFWSGSKFPAEG